MSSDQGRPVRRGPYPELTWTAIFVGWFLGAIIALSIGYAALILGFSIEGSELAAILGWGILRGILRRSSIVENNINQTVASAVNGASAGMMFSVPALYILARSDSRVGKERGMRRRRLKKLWARLHELQGQIISRDQLLLKLGAAKKDAGRVYGLVDIRLPKQGQTVSPESFGFQLRKDKLRQTRRREGRYLLRTNLCDRGPAELWRQYILLTEIEQAFKELKGDLAIRPIYHQLDHRIEAHIFVAFVAYCLMVTLKHRLRALAPGLTPRAVLEKLSAIQLIDVHLPTTDGRHLVLPRYTHRDQQLLLHTLKLKLPEQPAPRIAAQAE